VLPAGSAILTAARSGYNTEVVPGVNVPSSGSITQDIQLRPIVTAVSQIQFVLTWGAQPNDLDSHLSGPDGQGGRFHILYNNRAPVDFADLDIDDTDAFGPERVTVRRSASTGGMLVAGEYRYWVYNYNRSTFGPTDPNNPATASNAVVTVLVDGVQLARYLVANAVGNPDDDIWHVVNLQLDTTTIVAQTLVETLQLGDENTIL
jgi:hypothetical protein